MDPTQMGSALSTMGSVLISMPFVGLLPSAFFGVLWARSRLELLLAAALLWLLYSGYECLMKIGVLCSGECNIRIDLLAIYPFLLLISTLAIVVFVVWAVRHTPA